MAMPEAGAWQDVLSPAEPMHPDRTTSFYRNVLVARWRHAAGWGRLETIASHGYGHPRYRPLFDAPSQSRFPVAEALNDRSRSSPATLIDFSRKFGE